RPVHPNTGKDTPTPTHRQQHDHNTSDTPDAATDPPQPHDTPPTDISAASKTPTQPLAAYIRRVVDTAPAPTPAQLERLAGLLREPGNPSASS
ncbi:MAG: hypothetical protein ACRDTJ_18980, partial [Pseudonocardiaceae bacterium]